MRQWQQDSRTDDDNDGNISNLTNESYPSDIVDEVIKEHNHQMDEIFRTIEETRQRKQKRQGEEDQSSNSDRARNK